MIFMSIDGKIGYIPFLALMFNNGNKGVNSICLPKQLNAFGSKFCIWIFNLSFQIWSVINNLTFQMWSVIQINTLHETAIGLRDITAII